MVIIRSNFNETNPLDFFRNLILAVTTYGNVDNDDSEELGESDEEHVEYEVNACRGSTQV